MRRKWGQDSPRPDPWSLLLRAGSGRAGFWVPVSLMEPFRKWLCPPPHCPWQSTFVPQVRGAGPFPFLLWAPPAFLSAETLGLLPRHSQCDSGLGFRAQAHLRSVGVWSGQGPSPKPGQPWPGATTHPLASVWLGTHLTV